MKALASFVVVMLAAAGQAEVLLGVTENGAPSGTIRWSAKTTAKEHTEKRIISTGENSRNKTIITYWNAKGELTKVEFEMQSTSIINGRALKGRTSITATFPEGKDSEAIIRIPGKTIKQPIAQPPLPTEDPTVYWFVRDQPKIGTVVDYAAFDILNFTWQSVERTYVGRKPAPVPGFSGDTNVVTESRDGVNSTLYFDDTGQPVCIVTGTTLTVRK
jgi:hypothetical protein